MNLNDLEKKILLDCTDDYISVWNTIRMQNLQITTDQPVSQRIIGNSLSAIRNLLQMELIVAGHPEKGAFRISNLSCEEVMKRIEDEINKFEKSPLHYGFVFWFDITKKGEGIAKNILAAK
jgi:hypothetical protein